MPSAVWTAAGVWSLLLFAATGVRAWAFRANAFDLGFFVQAIGNLLPGSDGPGTSIAGFGLLNDHVSLLAIPLAPFARLGPLGLLAVQSIAVGLSMVLSWRFARRAGFDRAWSWVAMASFGVAPVMLYAVWFDFHPSLIGLPFLVLLAEGVQLESRATAAVGAIGASLSREDLALVVLLVGATLLRGDRRRLLPIVAAPAMVVLAFAVVQEETWFRANSYGYLTSGLGTGELLVLIPTLLWYGGSLALLVAGWLLPWAGWRRLSWLPISLGAMAAVPLLLSILPTVHTLGFHYYVFLAPLGLWAVVKAGRPSMVRRGPVVGAIVLSLVVGPLGLSLFAPQTPTLASVMKEAWVNRLEYSRIHGLLACVPPDAVISAVSPLVPSLAASHEVSVWPIPFYDLRLFDLVDPIVHGGSGQPSPDLVITASTEWDRPGLFPERVPELTALGYVAVLSVGNLVQVWRSASYEPSAILDCYAGKP